MTYSLQSAFWVTLSNFYRAQSNRGKDEDEENGAESSYDLTEITNLEIVMAMTSI